MVIALLRASHPEPALSVTVVAAALAAAAGHRVGSGALVVATVAASQLAVGWANDAVDARRDAAVGRTDKPVAAGRVSRRTVAVAAVVTAVAVPVCAAPLGVGPLAVAVVGLASAMAYNWPLKRTVVSPLPYAVSFAALPAFVVLSVPAPVPAWLPLAGALFGAGAHFANALPDLADDEATGVRGLPHRLGVDGSVAAAGVLLLAAGAVLVAGPPGPPAWWALAALAGFVPATPVAWYTVRRAVAVGRRTTAPFRVFQALALVVVGLLLVAGAIR